MFLFHHLFTFDDIDTSWQTIQGSCFRLHFPTTEVIHIERLTPCLLNTMNTSRSLDRQDIPKLLPHRCSLIGIHTALRHIQDTSALINPLKHIASTSPCISSGTDSRQIDRCWIINRDGFQT